MTGNWVLMFLNLIGAVCCIIIVALAASDGKPGVAVVWSIAFTANVLGFIYNLTPLIQVTSAVTS